MKRLVIATSLMAMFCAPRLALALRAQAAGDSTVASPVSFSTVAPNDAVLVQASCADTLEAAQAMQQAIAAFAKSLSADTPA